MDETTKDVAQPEGGEQIVPQSDPSPEVTEQDSPGGESQIEALSQQVNELQGMVRAFQSDEDRRIPTIERTLKTHGEQLEAYHQRRKAGQTHEQALREQALDEIAAERLGDSQVPPKEEPATPPTVAAPDYLSPVLKMAGLKDTDAAVVDILRKERDPGRQMSAIAELVETRKQAQQTPASPGAVLPTGDGETVETENLDSISAELNELAKNPSQNWARFQELKKKHAELVPKE